LAVGSLKSFSSPLQADRIRVLLSWADSGIAKRRATFQALRKAIGFLYVMLPAANAHPVQFGKISSTQALSVCSKIPHLAR
jgi:hypothetical protein